MLNHLTQFPKSQADIFKKLVLFQFTVTLDKEKQDVLTVTKL